MKLAFIIESELPIVVEKVDRCKILVKTNIADESEKRVIDIEVYICYNETNSEESEFTHFEYNKQEYSPDSQDLLDAIGEELDMIFVNESDDVNEILNNLIK